MRHDDSIYLLKKCNAGVKTAVNALENALRKSQSAELSDELSRSLETHNRLGEALHDQLTRRHSSGEEPSVMARSMAAMSMNLRYFAKPSDRTVANMVSDGCAMGARSLCHYVNVSPHADGEAKALAAQLVDTQHNTMRALEDWL